MMSLTCSPTLVCYRAESLNRIFSLTEYITGQDSTSSVVHIFPPILSVFVHAGLAALYAVSIYGQAGKDMSDPKHPQPGAPWYITKSCSVASTKAVRDFCQQAKGSFAVAVMMWYACPVSSP